MQRKLGETDHYRTHGGLHKSQQQRRNSHLGKRLKHVIHLFDFTRRESANDLGHHARSLRPRREVVSRRQPV